MNARIERAPGARSMRRMLEGLAIAAALLVAPTASVVLADDAVPTQPAGDAVTATVDTNEKQAPAGMPPAGQSVRQALLEAPRLQNYRPHDRSGLNMFEPPKNDVEAFQGKGITWGFAFTQQFQGVRHSNTAAPRMVPSGTTTVNANALIPIGNGFNNATANLFLDAQIAKGIRAAMTVYLSSRHHQETWVKDGFLLVNASPIDNDALNNLMKVLTLRVGHFEINYGDQHFRRSDNGNALFNPFVGNLLMDAFTTEIGAEAYLQKAGFLAMAGMTSGEIRGQVQRPNDRSPSYLAKLGVDRQLTPETRVRLTGSYYTNKKAVSSTLYTGSRAGSRYYSVLENAQSTEAAQAWSGDVQPGFRNEVTAWVINPFVKFGGVEFFGNVEQAKGKASTETSDRTWKQYAGEGLYRFFDEQLYVGGRYNVATGALAGITGDVTVERIQAGGGWFITSNIMAKAEYVRQNYMDFPANDIRAGAGFDGFMVEGVVAF